MGLIDRIFPADSRGDNITVKSRSWTEMDFFGARLEDESTLNYIREGYKENPYVYRAVKLMAQGIASLDIGVYEGRDDMQRREEHPAARLLSRPNPLQGKASYMEEFATRLLISGRAYFEAIGPDSGPPRELYVPEPDDIRPIFDRAADGFIQRYRSDEAQETWQPDEMHMVRLVDPENPLQGQSVIQAAARAADVSNYGRRYAHSLLKSMGVPPYMLTTEGAMTDEQKESFGESFAQRLRDAFNRMRDSGVTRPQVYDSMENSDFERLGMSPDEMSLLDLIQQSGREIAVAMGPAPELLGDPENKVYNNVSEAREALYTEHIMPLGNLICGELTHWLGEQFGFSDDLHFGFDPTRIPALQSDPESKRKTDLEALQAGAITINEYRERQGMEPRDGGDVLLVPQGSTPLAAAMVGGGE
jgi:HK97 family phage portal protein